MSQTEVTWATRSGRLVVYAIVGGLFVLAALRSNPEEAGGFGQALAELAQQPYGPWLLGLVALVCFAMASMPSYRHDTGASCAVTPRHGDTTWLWRVNGFFMQITGDTTTANGSRTTAGNESYGKLLWAVSSGSLLWRLF